MPGEYRNIYKTARTAAGLTQEAAAERLDISVESIRAYETGQRIPPNEVVELMVILYNAQHLAFQHLRETNALYGRIEKRGSLDRLMEIAEDNIIDDAERPEFMAIVAELREVIRGALELQLHCPSGA